MEQRPIGDKCSGYVVADTSGMTVEILLLDGTIEELGRLVGKICSDMRHCGVRLEVVLPMWVCQKIEA